MQDIVVREMPTSSNAINRQLDRVSHAVNVLVTALQSAWDRNERLDLQTGLLQHMFGGSVIDRQELRDLFIRQRKLEEVSRERADDILEVHFTLFKVQ